MAKDSAVERGTARLVPCITPDAGDHSVLRDILAKGTLFFKLWILRHAFLQ